MIHCPDPAAGCCTVAFRSIPTANRIQRRHQPHGPDGRERAAWIGVHVGGVGTFVPDLCEIEIHSIGQFLRPLVDDIGLLPLNDFLEQSGWDRRIVASRLAPWSKTDPRTGRRIVTASRKTCIRSPSPTARTCSTRRESIRGKPGRGAGSRDSAWHFRIIGRRTAGPIAARSLFRPTHRTRSWRCCCNGT